MIRCACNASRTLAFIAIAQIILNIIFVTAQQGTLKKMNVNQILVYMATIQIASTTTPVIVTLATLE